MTRMAHPFDLPLILFVCGIRTPIVQLYFDFISFAQYSTISNAMSAPLQVFQVSIVMWSDVFMDNRQRKEW